MMAATTTATTTNLAVVVDGSKHAHEAFETACRLLQRNNGSSGAPSAELLIVTYVETASRDHLLLPVLTPQERDLLTRRIELASRAMATPFRLQAEQRGIRAAIVALQGQHAGRMLCALVEERRIDYLVMSSQGLNRELAAATAAFVRDHAACNVVVVKGPPPAVLQHQRSRLREELEHYERLRQQQQQQQNHRQQQHYAPPTQHADEVHFDMMSDTVDEDHRGRSATTTTKTANKVQQHHYRQQYGEKASPDADDEHDVDEEQLDYAALEHRRQRRLSRIDEDDDYAEFAQLERQEWLAARRLAGQLPLGSSEAEDLYSSGSSDCCSDGSGEWRGSWRRSTVGGTASEAMAAARKSVRSATTSPTWRRADTVDDDCGLLQFDSSDSDF